LCSRRDSNPHHQNRNLTFYPLNYESKVANITRNYGRWKECYAGVGRDEETINQVLKGTMQSSLGTTGEKGWGFGLPMVKSLVDLLKGQIYISSFKEKGTRFEVLLPQI
jgi:glucose-6-phosphate-specific signal transduction histidine kinase